MIIAVDFDGTVVCEQPWDYLGPLRLQPNVQHALYSLKNAGHSLLLYSARANRSLQAEPSLDPMYRAGVISFPRNRQTAVLAQTRFTAMVDFVERELPGVFDAIDDGRQGKPNADLFIDNRAINFGPFGMDWSEIAGCWGV